METIGISCEIQPETLRQRLTELFPGLRFHYWEIDKQDHLPEEAILFTISRNKSEFPVRLELFRFPDADTAMREQYIARQLSVQLNCRTIVPYQAEGSSDPFCCVIFDKGKCYSADDRHTRWADGEGGEVKIIAPVSLAVYHVDSAGNVKRHQP